MANEKITSTGSDTNLAYRVVVLELVDVIPRIRSHLPNIYVGITTRTSQQLTDGLKSGRFRPTWARSNVVAPRDDLAKLELLDREHAKQVRDLLINEFRSLGYTVNRIERAYCTYVVNLHDPELKDPGKGYVYVGETSLTPDERLRVHLAGARSAKGGKLASTKVFKFGTTLNRELMNDHIYLTRESARDAERHLAENLRARGYVVEGGK